MATIKEVSQKASRFERIGAHTHVKGLGLDEKLVAIKIKEWWGKRKLEKLLV